MLFNLIWSDEIWTIFSLRWMNAVKLYLSIALLTSQFHSRTVHCTAVQYKASLELRRFAQSLSLDLRYTSLTYLSPSKKLTIERFVSVVPGQKKICAKYQNLIKVIIHQWDNCTEIRNVINRTTRGHVETF